LRENEIIFAESIKVEMSTTKKHDICAICFEDSTNSLLCGHFFHPKCIAGWAEHNSCPVCKRPIDKTKPVKKFGYQSDTSFDEELARRTLLGFVNEFDGVAPDHGLDDLLMAVMGAHNHGPRPGFIILPCPHHPPLEEKKEDQFLVSCANCGAGLTYDDPYINCAYCGDYFFCSNGCEEINGHSCHARRRVEEAEETAAALLEQERVNFTCADCGEWPCLCDEMPALEEICNDCEEAECMCSVYGD
jgi:hypothetical protein